MLSTRTLTIILLLLLVLLQYKIWFAHDGMGQTLHLKKALANQLDSNNQLLKHNQLLASQVNELKHNKDSVEDLAREELGMVKSNEQYYQFV